MAKTEEVKIRTRATGGKPAKEDKFLYTFAETLDEANEWYGKELCLVLINKAVRVGAQAAGRPLLSDDKAHDEIQNMVSAYKPETGSRRGRVKYIKDMDTLKEEFASMPPAEKQAMLAMFEAYLRGESVSVAPMENGEEENGDDDEESDDDDEDAEPPPPSSPDPPPIINQAQRRPPGRPRRT